MATTFQATDQTNPQNTFIDALLSKLNIDSRFIDEVAERVLSLAGKTPRTGPIKQADTKIPSSNNSTTTSQNKEARPPNNQSSTTNNTKKTDTETGKQTVKNESLNTAKSVFQIADSPKPPPQTIPEKEDTPSILDKFLKSVEKTTSRIEETVKKVPRPWELTPGTSIGYQMLTGQDSLKERTRKGLAQFAGRYATNIKEPWMFDIEDLKKEPLMKLFKQVITDNPDWLNKTSTDPYKAGYDAARETLYRDLFDMKSRATSNDLRKVADKTYTLDNSAPNPDLTKYYAEKEPWRNRENSKTVVNPILGNVNLSRLPSGNYKYNDIWDLITSGEESGKGPSGRNDEGSKSTYPYRKLISSILRPPSVTGIVTEKGESITYDETDLDTSKKIQLKGPTNNSEINLSNTISKEVSNKIEKMPILNTITKGLENIKGNKMLEGLKDISDVAPSIKPIVSFLTTNEAGVTPETTIGLADTTKNFNNLKDWMKETTVSKLNSWSTNLYDWSKQKINETTNSLDSVIDKTKSSAFNLETPKTSSNTNNPINQKGFDTETLKSLVKTIVPEAPPLQNTVSNDNVTLNNDALTKIVDNTKTTNDTVKFLSEAILKLAQTFNTKSNTPANNIVVGGRDNRQRENYPSAAQVAAGNNDPIRAVRSMFMPKM